MSVDLPGVGGDAPAGDVVADAVTDTFPKPRAHGAAVTNVLNDLVPSARDARPGQRGTLYDRAIAYYREHVGGHEHEPHIAVEGFEADWLPETSGSYVLMLTSSRWKAGTGFGDDYTAYYEQHLKLRELVEDDDDDEPRLRKPPVAVHVEIMPQYADLVYKSGDPLELPYGEGTRLVCWTTWAESGEAVERRMYDVVRAVYGENVLDVQRDRNHDSRKIQKAESHIRFHLDRKNAVVETLEQSKQLIDWGGRSEVQAHQERVQEGWLEARVSSDRWHLLGFDHRSFDTELKIYQVTNWHKRPTTDAMRHPKLEASFDGAQGALPHVNEWEGVQDYLRTVVATHARWAGIDRENLVADEFYPGPAAESWTYQRPTGRREMLQRRYEDRATDVYREALKDATTAPYDILRIVAEETGASYDTLEERTGLARSTVRYHVARLAEAGVLARKGNPVLVVYVSRELLERAREILRTARPERTREDMELAAQERRDRRERQRQEDDGETGIEDADECRDDADELGFRYLDHVEAGMGDVAVLHDRGTLDDRDVRVRADALPPDLR